VSKRTLPAERPQLDPSCRRPEPKPTAADYAFWTKRSTPEQNSELPALPRRPARDRVPSARRPEPKPTAADYAFWTKRFTPEQIAEMSAALNSWRA
jgi:hypothetical protein